MLNILECEINVVGMRNVYSKSSCRVYELINRNGFMMIISSWNFFFGFPLVSVVCLLHSNKVRTNRKFEMDFFELFPPHFPVTYYSNMHFVWHTFISSKNTVTRCTFICTLSMYINNDPTEPKEFFSNPSKI